MILTVAAARLKFSSTNSLWVALVFGFVAAGVVLSYKYDFNVRVFDEGLTLYGSSRIANGAVPYRDFWTTYGPGSYYVGALAFHLFGASVVTLRKIWLAFQSIAALEVMILARMFGGRTCGWLALALAVVATINANLHSGYTAVPATASALGSMIAYASHRVVAAGIGAGVTTVFRHDFGAYIAVTIVAGLWIRGRAKQHRIASDLVRFFTGMALVVLPIFGGLSWAAGFAPIIDQLVVFPATALAPYYVLRPSWAEARWFVMPALAIVVAGVGVAISALRDHRYLVYDNPRLIIVLCLFALGLFNYARVRLDRFHAWPIMMVAAPLIAAAPFIPTTTSRRGRIVAVVTTVFLVNVVLAFGMLVAKARIPVVPLVASPRGMGITIPETDASYNDLVRAIMARTRTGEPIFSGAVGHDRLFGTDVLLYFLTDRPAPTRYHELNRGLMASETVQAQIVEALERQSVRTVVLVDWPATESPRPSAAQPVTLLDDYIRANYRHVASFGHYELGERR